MSLFSTTQEPRRRTSTRSLRAAGFSVGDAVRAPVISAIVGLERLRTGVAYNPLSARTIRDPYPAYAALRARAPVHRSRLLRSWVFTRHADVDAILRDHRHFGSDPRKGSLTRHQLAMLPPPREFTLLFLDPPEHTRLRALVSRAFTPRAISALESRVRSILEGLLDAIDDVTAFDLREAVARPLPVIVMAEMLGVPAQDRARFAVWAAQRARLLEPTISRRERKAGGAASRAFDAYFRPIIEERRAAPRDDIVSALARAQDSKYVGTDDPIVNAGQGIVSGSDVTGVPPRLWVVSFDRDGPLGGGLSAKYTASRRVSLTADWYTDSYWTVDAYVSFRGEELGDLFRSTEFSIVTNNLLDTPYLSAITENAAWLGAARTVSMTVTVSF